MARCKEFSLDDVLAKSTAGPVLAIAGVQDPGNLGTILRSAEAFGAGGVLLGEGTVSPFNPKVVRASAGSVFRLPVARGKLSEALRLMKKQGLRTVATASHIDKGPGGQPLYTTTKIEAKWLGACKPDQKPGDIMMPGGMKMNVKDMEKLKALLPKPK